jgi:hypothetical protein
MTDLVTRARFPAWLDRLRPTLASVQIDSATSLRLDGEQVDVSAQPPVHREDHCFNPDPLVHLLHRHLYDSCHTAAVRRHAALPPPEKPGEAPGLPVAADGPELAEELLKAHGGPPWLSRGWKVLVAMKGGEVCAQKARRVRVWRPGQYVFDGAPARPKNGDSVHVLIGSNSLTLQPGFYHAFGRFVADEACEERSVRFYLNVRYEGAAALVRLLCGTLDARAVPFQFKCLTGGSDYGRCDSAVLYVGKRYARLVVSLLGEMYDAMSPHLRDETPLLAKRLAPGVSLAEDPNTDDSFGTHRTRAIAEGLRDAFVRGLTTEDERLTSVLASFDAHNISTAKPYLNAKPADPYGLDHLELFS